MIIVIISSSIIIIMITRITRRQGYVFVKMEPKGRLLDEAKIAFETWNQDTGVKTPRITDNWCPRYKNRVTGIVIESPSWIRKRPARLRRRPAVCPCVKNEFVASQPRCTLAMTHRR